MAGWFFKELEAGIVRRTPHEEEFFNTSTKISAVVREAIQNSIDAKQPGEDTVMVRFYVGITRDGISELLLSGLSEHLIASKVFDEEQLHHGGLPFLAIEDFNSTGLTGDLDSTNEAARKGDFYNFWWADGSLKKKGQSGGRWGLGKYTFFLSSRVKSFWGLTSRNETPRKVLMGRSLLKPHNIGEKFYNLDGFFASSQDFKPILNSIEIDEFESVFQLKRGQFSGLSIVIPMPFEDVNADSILRAVLDQCLFSIVRDQVKTNISEGEFGGENTEIKLNQNSVIGVLKQKMLDNPNVFVHYYNLAKLYKLIQESEVNWRSEIYLL